MKFVFLLCILISSAFAANWIVRVGYGVVGSVQGTALPWSVFRFFPENLTIVAGDSVTFVHRDDGRFENKFAR
jgi:hypothetical protein